MCAIFRIHRQLEASQAGTDITLGYMQALHACMATSWTLDPSTSVYSIPAGPGQGSSSAGVPMSCMIRDLQVACDV